MVPPAVYVSGRKNQGKTYVLKKVLKENCGRYAWINMEEEHRSRDVYRSILAQISEGGKHGNGNAPAPYCENVVSFITQLQVLIDENISRYEPNEQENTLHYPFFLVSSSSRVIMSFINAKKRRITAAVRKRDTFTFYL